MLLDAKDLIIYLVTVKETNYTFKCATRNLLYAHATIYNIPVVEDWMERKIPMVPLEYYDSVNIAEVQKRIYTPVIGIGTIHSFITLPDLFHVNLPVNI